MNEKIVSSLTANHDLCRFVSRKISRNNLFSINMLCSSHTWQPSISAVTTSIRPPVVRLLLWVCRFCKSYRLDRSENIISNFERWTKNSHLFGASVGRGPRIICKNCVVMTKTRRCVSRGKLHEKIFHKFVFVFRLRRVSRLEKLRSFTLTFCSDKVRNHTPS